MKDDYRNIYTQLVELQLQKSLSLGPSNTQLNHPVSQQLSKRALFDLRNKHYSSINVDLDLKTKKQDSFTSNQQNHKTYQYNSDSKDSGLLKKRTFGSLVAQQSIISTNSQEQQKQNHLKEKEFNSIDLKQSLKQTQKRKLDVVSLQQNNSLIQTHTSKRNSNTSFHLSKNSIEDEDQDEKYQNKFSAKSDRRKQTTCRMPEITLLRNNKENTQNQINSFLEYNSQTTINPDQSIPSNLMPIIQQVYQLPQNMIMPLQNSFTQPIMIPINTYIQQPNIAETNVLNVNNPTKIQVLMNPFSLQNIYYQLSHPGYSLPVPLHTIQPQQQIINLPFHANLMQSPCITYGNQAQQIPIFTDSQDIQQSVIDGSIQQQQQQPQIQQKQYEK